ncbi:hypothetical protein VTO73DRAFT_4156 [Trametes versicolor]
MERSDGSMLPRPIGSGDTAHTTINQPLSQTNVNRSDRGGREDPPPLVTDLKRLEGIKDLLKLERLLDQRKDIHPEKKQTEAWSDAAGAVKTYSDSMVHRWNKEIDVYLVFAALFSAILTAFNVESYKLLQLPPPDDTAITLQCISTQLQSFTISPPFVNATHSVPSDVASTCLGTPSFVPEYAVKLNTLWFSGLILSLASTVIGILAKQWIGEYSNGLTGTSVKAALRRQYRLNNLIKWRVGHIIALIPILLLISLTLFLAGILVLVWQLHPSVARVASVLVAIVVGSTTAVTLLPLCMRDCAYISPQTRLLLFLWPNAIYPVFRVVFSPVTLILWSMVTIHRRVFVSGGGLQAKSDMEKWLRDQFPLAPIGRSTWRGHERAVVNRLSNTLGVDMLIQWYDSTLSDKAVSSAVICLLAQAPDSVLDYFVGLDKAVSRHFNEGDSPGIDPVDDLLVRQVLICAVYLGSRGLLEKRHFSHLRQVSNYLPTGSTSKFKAEVWDLARDIHDAATRDQDMSGSVPYPIKKAVLDAQALIFGVQSEEDENASVQSEDDDNTGVVRGEPEAQIGASGHATCLQDYSIVLARLNYLSAADQYLSCAAPILSDPPSTETVALVQSGACQVLRELYYVAFKAGRGRDNLRHGSRDYLILMNNLLDTINAHYHVFHPLIWNTNWMFYVDDFDRLDTLRLALEKQSGKYKKYAVIINAQRRYPTGNLQDAIECYKDHYRSAPGPYELPLRFDPKRLDLHD